MKTYCSIVTLTICLTFFCACTKWLDEKPSQDLAIPTTLKDFQALLDNSSKLNQQSASLHEIASDGHYVLPTNAATLNDLQYNAYSWTKEKSNNSSTDWTKSYSNIFTCNMVLEGLAKIKIDNGANQVIYDNVKGQALMHRAIKFYEVAQAWAPSLTGSHEKNEYGIPLRLESNINIPSTRATVQNTYEQIISDLINASMLLPVTPLYKTRPSKPAAFAMLSRVYLAIEDYEKAGAYADSCLKFSSTLLNFNNLPASTPWPIARFNDEVIMHSSLSSYTALGSRLLVDRSLFELYKDGDLRKTVFFKMNTNGTIGFKGNYGGDIQPFCGLATDEQFLIRAECHARSGRVSEAIEILNHFLQTRWDSNVAYIPLTAMNQDEALQQVLTERKKELLLRGLRWTDLRRLNRDPRFRISVIREVGTTTYILEPESYKYTLPIPDDIILQSGIKQNPGWE